MFLKNKFKVISLTEKVKSHLLPDLTAKDRAREYSFYMEDRLKMQRYGSMIFRSRKSMMASTSSLFYSDLSVDV